MHAHTYAYTHICIHTHMHAHTYAYTHICIHTHMHTHTYAYTHICIHTHMHTHTYACTHICIHTHMHTHTYAYTHICMHTRTRTQPAPTMAGMLGGDARPVQRPKAKEQPLPTETSFSFLSKSNKSSAFDFVQEEMKASQLKTK